jgi:DNA-directed RNA polymerase III subunit RPC3
VKLALQLRPLSGGNARQGEADDGFGGACPKSTPPFTLEALLSRCTAPLGVDREALSNYLDTMCREPLVEMATTYTLNGAKYVLRLRALCGCAQQLLMEAAVRDRFGERACRLFRLLVRKRARGPPRYSRSGNLKLELKQLTRMSLMPDREARPLLLKLFQANLLMLQEVPRSADRVPKGTTYLWHVDPQQARGSLQRDVLCCLNNMEARLVAERESLMRLQREQHYCEAPVLHIQLQQQRSRVRTLEGAILRMHGTLMLLRF